MNMGKTFVGAGDVVETVDGEFFTIKEISVHENAFSVEETEGILLHIKKIKFNHGPNYEISKDKSVTKDGLPYYYHQVKTALVQEIADAKTWYDLESAFHALLRVRFLGKQLKEEFDKFHKSSGQPQEDK